MRNVRLSTRGLNRVAGITCENGVSNVFVTLVVDALSYPWRSQGDKDMAQLLETNWLEKSLIEFMPGQCGLYSIEDCRNEKAKHCLHGRLFVVISLS